MTESEFLALNVPAINPKEKIFASVFE